MKLQKAVGIRVSNLLIKNNLTRYAFCKNIGMSDQTLKHIIDERNDDVKLNTIYLLAEGFGLTLEEFFADELFKNLD